MKKFKFIVFFNSIIVVLILFLSFNLSFATRHYEINSNTTIPDNQRYTDYSQIGPGGVFEITKEGTLNLGVNVNFSTNTAQYGGSISNSGELNVGNGVTFISNSAVESGGAISNNSSGEIIINSNSSFISNSSSGLGGGAINNHGNITIDSNVFFSSNTANNGYGGAILMLSGTLNIGKETVFSSNTAKYNGGAIYNQGGIINIDSNSSFTSNSAETSGGAIQNQSGIVNIGNEVSFNSNKGDAICNFGEINIGNNVAFNDGGIRNSVDGIINIGDGSMFTSNNRAISNSDNGKIIINSNAIFSSNNRAIQNNVNGNIAITSATFILNSSQSGGAAIQNSANITITSTTFNLNSSEYGGAILNSGNITITSTTFISNSSQSGGAAIQNSGTVNIDGGMFINNKTELIYGGAIYNNKGTLNLISNRNNIEFTGNIAKDISIAIYDNLGIINLYASENADIIFNDSIYASQKTSVLNINNSTTTLTANGKVILNADMNCFWGITNLYNGNLELREGNKGFNGIFTIYGGTFTVNANSIITDFTNNGTTILIGGENNNWIHGIGTTIIDGEVINSSTIANNVTINSQKQLTTNATNIDGQIENNGDLIFNGGTNDNYIYGNGELSIEGYVISNSSITQSTVTVASAGKFENNNELQLMDYINNGTTVNNSTISVSGEYYNVGITTNTNYIKANTYTNKADSVMDNTGMIDADEFSIENGSMFNTSFDNLVIKGDFENDGEVTVKGGEIKNNILGEGKLIIENVVVNNKDINQSSITINTKATLTNNKNITLDQILINNGQLTNESNIETEQLNNVASSTITNNSNFTVNKKGQNYGRIDGNGILNINDDFDNFNYLRQSLINISSGTFTNENTVISDSINLQEKAKLISNASNITGNILNTGNVILNGGENNNWIHGIGTTIIDGEVINSSTIATSVTINKEKQLTTKANNVTGNINNLGNYILVGGENNSWIHGTGTTIIDGEVINSNTIENTLLINNNSKLINDSKILISSGTNNGIIEIGTKNISNMTITGGNFINNGKINQNIIKIENDAIIKLTKNAILTTNDLIVDNATIDMANSIIQEHNFNTLTIDNTLSLAVDADLANKKMDAIAINNFSGNGEINIKAINIIKDAKEEITEIVFTTSTILKNKITSINSASSKLYKYNVVYNNGYFYFTNINPEINPIVAESAIALSVGGFATQANVLGQAFTSIDMQISNRKQANKKGIYYASTSNHIFDMENKIENGLWIRPYTVQEAIKFNDMDVDNTVVGTLAGLDLATGENSLLSLYLGYAGSNQKYEDIKVSQTGYIIGATGMIIKEKCYAGLTANINFNKAESQSDYGTDEFDMNMYSIGAKAGYNFDLSDKWILEPNLMLMYGTVSNQEYETTQGAKVDSQSNSNIIVEPQVKAKLSLDNGWQPYGLLGYVANISDKAKVVVDGTEFETDKINGYVEYGAGVNKDFINTPWSCYLEATGRSGGRNGFAGNLGIKYKF